MRQRGFTLIELLVVITILGLLITMVIVALVSIRQDAFNTRIQSNVRQMRALAESAYDSNGASYVNWSQSPSVAADVTTLLNDIDAAHSDAAGSPYMAQVRETQVKEFCVSAPLHSATSGFACVDATGVFRTTTTACPDEPINGNPLRCPAT
jgi:prepilin-type N-terminal cleavage/methylation domain-containing protein